MTMASFVLALQLFLGIGAALALARAIEGPTLADRIIGVDLVLLLLAAAIGAQAAVEGSELFTVVAVVVALVAFAGTVLIAKYIEWKDEP